MNNKKKKILVTGCAGLIGYHLCRHLINNKQYKIYGIDNINSYYDINLKKNRLNILSKKINNFSFFKINIANKSKLNECFKKYNFDIVINLAAQAGVRYSINNPQKYFYSNIRGFFNILDLSKKYKIKHLLFASTSSVYGDLNTFPLKEDYKTDSPLSFYAATKKCNEVMAYSYSNIHDLPCTGMRFFTVYGPMGRPDMSLYKFTKSILNKEKIQLFNNGNHTRDFTYIDDVVESISKIINQKPKTKIPFQILNIASSKPVHLKKFIKEIEKNTGMNAKHESLPIQKGDIIKTHANISRLKKLINYQPKTSIEKGIQKFVNWYMDYFNYNKK